jgi:hypothetical protein
MKSIYKYPLEPADSPTGVDSPPSPPVGPSLAKWLEPAVMTVLDREMHYSDVLYDDNERGSYKRFEDVQEWQEHIVPLICEHLAQALPDYHATLVPGTVTRVVLVHADSKYTEKWAESWDLHIQDDGRTLKLFPRKPTEPRYEHTPGFFDYPPHRKTEK